MVPCAGLNLDIIMRLLCTSFIFIENRETFCIDSSRLENENVSQKEKIRISLVLPTAREGNVFTGVCHSVHNWSIRILLECFLVRLGASACSRLCKNSGY